MAAIHPLSPMLGARVEGVDLSAPIGDSDFAAVERGLHDHGFVVLPRQTLTPAGFVDFSRRWGRPEPHVIDRFHHPADPNILILSNVHRDGEPIGLVDAGTYFHTDYSYLSIPARCTILYAIQMPASNGGTIYNGMGHQAAVWSDSKFLKSVLGSIQMAAGFARFDCPAGT